MDSFFMTTSKNKLKCTSYIKTRDQNEKILNQQNHFPRKFQPFEIWELTTSIQQHLHQCIHWGYQITAKLTEFIDI